METVSSSSFGDVTFFDNPVGWGPTEDSIPSKFVDIPHSQYRKFDSLSKVADSFGSATTKSRDHVPQAFGSQTAFNNYGADDSSFYQSSDFKKRNVRTASSRTAPKESSGGAWQQPSRSGPPKGRAPSSRNVRDYNSYSKNTNSRQNNFSRNNSSKNTKDSRFDYNKSSNYNYNYNREGGPGGQGPKKAAYRQDKATRDTSVEVKADWKVLEQIDFSELRKIKGENPSDPENIQESGTLPYYDPINDSIKLHSNTPLVRAGNERSSPNTTTTDDQIIRDLSLRYAEEYPDSHIFFITDSILSHLMTCPRSVYSWDVVIQRVNKFYFFDKREESTIDLPTVNETSGLPSNQNEDQSAERLSQEAAFINQVFTQQVLSKTKAPIRVSDDDENAGDEEDVAPVLYRYRKWDLGDDNILIVRCEVNCAVEENTKTKYGYIRALNEFDPKVTGIDWRHSLETQRGTVLATEIKNNAHKLAKWTVSAMLGGCEWMKLGYVTRGNRGLNVNSHVVLGVQSYRPLEFGPQSVGLSVSNLWGVWRVFMEMSKGLKNGQHVLVKDPAKGLVRLYEVPADAFGDGEGQAEDD